MYYNLVLFIQDLRIPLDRGVVVILVIYLSIRYRYGARPLNPPYQEDFKKNA